MLSGLGFRVAGLSFQLMRRYRVVNRQVTPKKRRRLCIPSDDLRRELGGCMAYFRELDDYLDIGVNHAYKRSRSCVTNAHAHVGYTYTLELDFENWFDTITPANVERHLHEFFIDLCFVKLSLKRQLPQGYPTSPILSSIAGSDFDVSITEMLDGEDVAYTRFSDNVFFSFNSLSMADELSDLAREYATIEGWKLNEKKIRLMGGEFCVRKVTGWNVYFDRVTPTRETKRKLRAARHSGNESSERGLTEWMKGKLPRR